MISFRFCSLILIFLVCGITPVTAIQNSMYIKDTNFSNYVNTQEINDTIPNKPVFKVDLNHKDTNQKYNEIPFTRKLLFLIIYTVIWSIVLTGSLLIL